MAAIDELVKQVDDARLRRELEAAVAELKRKTRFGLVYESHLPEMAALPGVPIEVDSLVVRREKLSAKHAFRVAAIEDGAATLEPVGGGPAQCAPVGELVALQRFGEPIYPGLEKVGSVERGGADRPHHAVINAENYHAVQLLLHLYEGQVDCLYLDPPYNTGARDWTYNNDYVDSSDAFRHSKWLSFMEKRLQIHHLGTLLEEVLPQHLKHTITIVINPKGTAATNFARVDEYALFVCPPGMERIEQMPFDFALPVSPKKDSRRVLLPVEDTDKANEDEADDYDKSQGQYYRKLALRRDGAESSNRIDRPRQFYAIYVDETSQTVAGIGPELSVDEPFQTERVNGLLPVYPLDPHGRHRVWRYGRDTMTCRINKGEIKVGSYVPQRGTYSL